VTRHKVGYRLTLLADMDVVRLRSSLIELEMPLQPP